MISNEFDLRRLQDERMPSVALDQRTHDTVQNTLECTPPLSRSLYRCKAVSRVKTYLKTVDHY